MFHHVSGVVRVFWLPLPFLPQTARAKGKRMRRTGGRKGKRLVRKSISLDPDDYAAMDKLTSETEVSLS